MKLPLACQARIPIDFIARDEGKPKDLSHALTQSAFVIENPILDLKTVKLCSLSIGKVAPNMLKSSIPTSFDTRTDLVVLSPIAFRVS